MKSFKCKTMLVSNTPWLWRNFEKQESKRCPLLNCNYSGHLHEDRNPANSSEYHYKESWKAKISEWCSVFFQNIVRIFLQPETHLRIFNVKNRFISTRLCIIIIVQRTFNRLVSLAWSMAEKLELSSQCQSLVERAVSGRNQEAVAS